MRHEGGYTRLADWIRAKGLYKTESEICMGGNGALNYLPIVLKASVYVPTIMHKPVMGGITMSQTFTYMFLFKSARSFEN